AAVGEDSRLDAAGRRARQGDGGGGRRRVARARAGERPAATAGRRAGRAGARGAARRLMALTIEAAAATEAHRLAQARIGTATARGLLRTWRLLDPFNLDGTVGSWLDAATSVVTAGHTRSVAEAISYLRSFRVAELVGLGDLAGAGAAFDPVAAALNLDARRTSLLVTRPVAIKAGTRRGLSGDRLVAEARAASARAGMRHALNGGRDTIIESVKADSKAQGWARATSGRPCAFCAMLASRGPV